MFWSDSSCVHEVERRDLEEVDLAGLQRRHGGLRVRHVDDHDRSTFTTLPPAMPDGASERGT